MRSNDRESRSHLFAGPRWTAAHTPGLQQACNSSLTSEEARSRDAGSRVPRGFLKQSLRINESPVNALYRKLDRLARDEDRHSAL